MAGTQHFSPGDIQFQLVYDRGQCAETSYLKPISHSTSFDISICAVREDQVTEMIPLNVAHFTLPAHGNR